MFVISLRSLFLLFVALFWCAVVPALADKGMLEITSEPGGAKVFINDRLKGYTPTQQGKALVLELEEGEYQIKWEMGAVSLSQSIYVGSGAIQPVSMVIPTYYGFYLLYPNGIALDTRTKLMWQRCDVGQIWNGNTCTGEASNITWNDAMPNGQQKSWASFAGYSDWRMPTIEELRSLVYCSSGNPKTWNDTSKECKGNYQKPTIDTTAFPGTLHWVWSSSADASGPTGTWSLSLYFGNGNVGWTNGSDAYQVRLVRAGQ